MERPLFRPDPPPLPTERGDSSDEPATPRGIPSVRLSFGKDDQPATPLQPYSDPGPVSTGQQLSSDMKAAASTLRSGVTLGIGFVSDGIHAVENVVNPPPPPPTEKEFQDGDAVRPGYRDEKEYQRVVAEERIDSAKAQDSYNSEGPQMNYTPDGRAKPRGDNGRITNI